MSSRVPARVRYASEYCLKPSEVQMNVSPASRGSVARALRFVLRGLLIALAGFWAWFVAMVSSGEAPTQHWWIPVAWIGGMAALVVLCWKRPTLGGLALVAAGLWAGVTFAHPGAR